jgi:hypothetical protein
MRTSKCPPPGECPFGASPFGASHPRQLLVPGVTFEHEHKWPENDGHLPKFFLKHGELGAVSPLCLCVEIAQRWLTKTIATRLVPTEGHAAARHSPASAGKPSGAGGPRTFGDAGDGPKAIRRER